MARMRTGDPVDGRDGPLGIVAGTREAAGGPATSPPAYVLVRGTRRFGLDHTTYLVPLAWVKAAPADAPRVVLDAGRAEVAGCPPLRDDEAIRAELARALAETHRPFRVAAIGATVRRGVVDLGGHAPGAKDARAAVARARAVPGVLDVRDHVVVDEALVGAVAQALARDPVTRKACLRVASRLGTVALSGVLPTDAVGQHATAVALTVPGVMRVHDGTSVPAVPTGALFGSGRPPARRSPGPRQADDVGVTVFDREKAPAVRSLGAASAAPPAFPEGR
jgi:osmotically-inducible protein OsmY